jgi:hypothetical protein
VWTGPETTERELKTAVVLVLPQFSPELTAGFALALLNEGAEADLPDI